MANKQTAVDWLMDKMLQNENAIFIGGRYLTLYEIRERAKAMEKEQEHETKQYWFGRGILAEKENRIEELKPIKDNGTSTINI